MIILIICLGIYIIFGILLNFIHPEIAELNPILKKVYRPSINDYIALGKYNPRWKRILAVVVIRFVIIVIGPAASSIDLITKAINNGKKIILRQYEDEDYYYLYLFDINGAGEVQCMLCGYTTKLTGAVSGGIQSVLNLNKNQQSSCKGRVDSHKCSYTTF